MGWKNWPYWLRGGIIGIVIAILQFIILGLYFNQTLPYGPEAGIIGGILLIFGIVIILLSIVIGFVIGKIKSKK